MDKWTRIGFVALCGVLGAGCLSETRYVCPPGSDITASTRCGAACASGELSEAECVAVREACADGRLSEADCAGIEGDSGVPDMGRDQDVGPDGDVTDIGEDIGVCGACGGTEPHCNTTTMQCVECLDASHCAGRQCSPEGLCVDCLDETHCDEPTPVCLAGDCVGCAGASDCTAANPVCEAPAQACGDCTIRNHCNPHNATTPACDPATGQCVQCDEANEDADCNGNALTPRCNATGQCVQCRAGTATLDCTAVTASRCAGNTCAACTNHTDCSHLAATPRCFNNTRCVECTPATEAADCGAESCNPTTRECSGINRNSRTVCQQCVSDSDCSQAGGTFRCIPMNYMGSARGGYCMRAAPGCTRPFGVIINAASLSGAAAANYCGIDQSVASCEAVNALRSSLSCPSGSAAECMAPGALCETVGGFDDRCTYACSVPDECPASGPPATCGAGYCGS